MFSSTETISNVHLSGSVHIKHYIVDRCCNSR